MEEEYLEAILKRLFDAKQLTNSRREELDQLVRYGGGDPRLLGHIRDLAFKIAVRRMMESPSLEILERVEEISRNIDQALAANYPSLAEVHFNPGEECLSGILRLFKHAQQSIDICVFTITDDRITEAIYQMLKRGRIIRIITDDEKIKARGSDIVKIANAGIPVKIDHASEHMHHKFAIFDCRILLTGSFNWTRSASTGNHENLLVTDDLRLVKPFCREFERLWKKFPAFRLE